MKKISEDEKRNQILLPTEKFSGRDFYSQIYSDSLEIESE